MAFVLDASLAAAWCLPDEAHPLAERALERLREDPGIVPALFWYEIRSVLLNAERRGRVEEADVGEALARLRQLPISVRNGGPDTEVLGLARRYLLTAYDACYLAVARAEDCPLASLDQDLVRAARAEGVVLLE